MYNVCVERKRVLVAVLNQGTTCAGMETQLFKWMQQGSDKYEFNIIFPRIDLFPTQDIIL